MFPTALPPVSPRATGQIEETDLESGLAQIEHTAASSPQRDHAQIDARLQGLPQRPVRPEIVFGFATMSPGQRIAKRVALTARIMGGLTASGSICPMGIGVAGLISKNDEMKKYGIIGALAIPTAAAFFAIDRVASAYAKGPNAEARARALGTDAKRLHRATELVTMPDEESNRYEINDAERMAISVDLMNLATLDQSILDPDLVNIVRNAGCDADKLVAALLNLKRQPEPDLHAAASSCA
ncbi:hypothetical protein KCU57_05495 [Xanthomonas translucens]|uniref:hypothetical protein n=1 Tax=Xanthomonas campestris pv. translucens TaxID=343 RepID=UPI001F3BAA08|nr:hypothetical protein [Xanthomonas translucens]UKE51761.1 hypothetical protein KCU57_05495 [Xanthomonas translucens]